ncbi:DUF943 family protein [Pantoea sp. CCBC3-3-1]|uniref:DUF943 family protein n=1 Tax=Pantoea sp. CCBC3-3-1 TaxID=2490851 RepID=UPI0011BE1F0A|nr:DUF943 family protein [Pantoea sp. CCBC3-3-1]
MLNKTKIQLTAFAVILITMVIFISQQAKETKIVAVIDGLVFVENAPDNSENKITWWNNNKSLLQNKYHLIPENDYFTLPIMNFGDGYVKLPHANFLSGDNEGDYICDNSIKNEKRCIKKETSFTVMGEMKSSLFISINGEMYKQNKTDKSMFSPVP